MVHLRIRLILLLCMAPLAASAAQRVTGTVRVAGMSSFLSGAVVTTLDSAGRAIARTLSDQNGRYSLPVAPEAKSVRAVRIGFRPATAGIPGGAGDVTADLSMEPAPVVLATVKVSADGECGSAKDGRLALDAWEQARSALLAAIVAREANPSRVVIQEYQRRMERSRRLVTEQRLNSTSGVSSRPVAAARTGAQLAAAGYVDRNRAGDLYLAPDADVLFDQSFADAHCFGMTRGEKERAGQLGLTFRPRERKRDFVDVQGTLWINPQAPELLQLDYTYTGVDPEAARAGAGGSIHFRTMANGVVFIDAWSILVPTLTEVRQRGLDGNPTARGVVNDLAESGAHVVSASWRDGTTWTQPVGAVAGKVVDREGKGVGGVALSVPGLSLESSMTGAFALAPLPPGRYQLSMADSAYSAYVRPRKSVREVVVAPGDTVSVDFELPTRQNILGELCRSQRELGNTYVLLGQLGDGTGEVPENLKVEASWYGSVAGGVSIDATSVSQSTEVTAVNSTGGFYICGIPLRSSKITLRVMSGRMTVRDTVIPAGSVDAPARDGTRQLDWTVPQGSLAAAVRGDAASLTGRVTRNGQPMPNTQVWVVFADTMVTTDSTGRYRVAGLRAGPQLLEVRRIGFAPKRDTVVLRPRDETVRDISMDAARMLDTMRTVGKGRAYETPRLQDFERRRLSGMGGHFVSEDELRAMEGVSMPSILRSHIPGIKMHSYRGQTFAAAFSSTKIGHTIQLGRDGPTGCWVSVWVDGVMVFDRVLPSVGSRPVEVLPPDINQFFALNLSGVEYYPNGPSTPYQFRTVQNECGSLVFWTRGR